MATSFCKWCGSPESRTERCSGLPGAETGQISCRTNRPGRHRRVAAGKSAPVRAHAVAGKHRPSSPPRAGVIQQLIDQWQEKASIAEPAQAADAAPGQLVGCPAPRTHRKGAALPPSKPVTESGVAEEADRLSRRTRTAGQSSLFFTLIYVLLSLVFRVDSVG